MLCVSVVSKMSPLKNIFFLNVSTIGINLCTEKIHTTHTSEHATLQCSEHLYNKALYRTVPNHENTEISAGFVVNHLLTSMDANATKRNVSGM